MKPTSEQEAPRSMGASFSWSLVETSGGILLTLMIYMVLGNLLGPRDFGLVAVAMIAAHLVIPLSILGMGEGLIHSRRFSAELVSSVLWLAVGLALVWAGVLWLLAPALERWLMEPGLARIVRFLSFLPVYEVVFRTTGAVLRRELLLRPLAVRRIAGLILSGSVSIWLATWGAGAAALAVFHLMNGAFSAIFLLWKCPVGLRPVFSSREVAGLFPYAWNVTGLTLLEEFRKRLLAVLVGAAYGVEVLGIYAFADRIASLFQEAVGRAVRQFAFPLFSKLRDEKMRLQSIFVRSVEWVSGLSLMAYGGLAWLASDLLSYFFDDRWLGAGWLVPILVIGYLAESFLSVLDALGRAQGCPQVILGNRLLATGLFLGIFAVAAPYGLYALFLCVSLGWLLISPLLYRRVFAKMDWRMGWKPYRAWIPVASLLLMMGAGGAVQFLDLPAAAHILFSGLVMMLVYISAWLTLHPEPREVLFFWRWKSGDQRGCLKSG